MKKILIKRVGATVEDWYLHEVCSVEKERTLRLKDGEVEMRVGQEIKNVC